LYFQIFTDYRRKIDNVVVKSDIDILLQCVECNSSLQYVIMTTYRSMFRQPLVIILSFGLLGSGIDGRCRGDKNCGGQALTRKQKHHASKSARFSQIRFSPCRTRHYHITRFCTDCRIDDCNGDRNAISDNCWNCCCNRFSLPSSSSSTSSITNASSESEGGPNCLTNLNPFLLIEPAPVDNFPPHDCCTRCSGANCMQRNSNAIIFGASTFKNRQNRSMKCKNKELGKLMIAKFAAQFNVICSRGHFSYVTHTSEYCEVSNRGTICYAFKIH
uniref:Ground-like domain-containing protein n=1 Tax=Elaeophora elaphi TaxID=1147741 RepID=A0A0R3S665_9BILA